MATKRYTNEDRARDLCNTLRLVRDTTTDPVLYRDTTTDPVLYREADEGARFASHAAWDYNSARDFDSFTGGGSGKAWALRSKAGRALAKARKIMIALTQERVDLARAPFGTPSIANVLFLRRVAQAAADGWFAARMVDEPDARPCERHGWIVMRSPAIGPVWVLTEEGAEVLARFAALADGIAEAG